MMDIYTWAGAVALDQGVSHAVTNWKTSYKYSFRVFFSVFLTQAYLYLCLMHACSLLFFEWDNFSIKILNMDKEKLVCMYVCI